MVNLAEFDKVGRKTGVTAPEILIRRPVPFRSTSET